MWNKELIITYLQNKNFVMLFASMLFMAGILSYFASSGIIIGVLLNLGLILLMYLRILDIKKVLIFICIFYIGFFLTYFKIKNSDDLFPLAPLNSTFTGQIVSIPNSSDSTKSKFFMNVEIDGKYAGKTLVTVSDSEENLSKLNIGDKIKIKGSLRVPFKSSNPSQFDYSAYLRNFNAFTVLYADENSFEILEEKLTFKWKFLQELNNTRNKVLKTHSKYLKSPNLEILGGIVFGDDAVSPPEYIKNSFINSGLLHILAASGMNVAFIFSFWFCILGFFKVPYKPRVFSGMLVVVLYTLMTGLGAAVVRASLMLLFVLAGKLIDREAHSVSLLSLVAMIMLIYNPAYINDVSFQLSFMVTLGLLLNVNMLSNKLEKIPNWLLVPVIIPIIAQIWVAPIQMYYFNTFSLYSILANISTVSILSVISFCGFVSSVIAIVPACADYSCMVFDFVNNYLLNILVCISNFFSNLPNCIIQTTHPNILQMILYYFMLGFVTLMIKLVRYKNAFVAVVCVSILLVGLNVRFESPNLEIIAFDVQNADSFLIKTPKNKYFFIDTGKKAYKSGNSQAKIIMLKYLKDLGIKNIEGVIVTHFDNDHSGGTSDIISDTKVKTLYLNNKSKETETAQKIFNTANKIGQNIEYVQNNKIIYEEPNLTLKTFKANILGKNKDNDCSTIALLSYKDFDMLFMGDAGTQSFDSVKKDIPHNVEVLKVGHHGAAHVVNKQMIDYLDNRVSLISTGINYYGHPAKGTLDVLRNTDILRTDLLNSIKIETDGSLYKISSYDNKKKKYFQREHYYSK